MFLLTLTLGGLILLFLIGVSYRLGRLELLAQRDGWAALETELQDFDATWLRCMTMAIQARPGHASDAMALQEFSDKRDRVQQSLGAFRVVLRRRVYSQPHDSFMHCDFASVIGQARRADYFYDNNSIDQGLDMGEAIRCVASTLFERRRSIDRSLRNPVLVARQGLLHLCASLSKSVR